MARAYSVTSGPLFPIVNITLLVDLDDVLVKLSVVGVSAPAGHSTIVILYLDAYTYINTKNCSLSIVLTATDQKPQKSLKRLYLSLIHI